MRPAPLLVAASAEESRAVTIAETARRVRRRANLKRLLRPARIAFVGGRHLERCIALCRRAGFPGVIETVNPSRAEIAGIRCAPSVEALAEPPDAAFVALSRERSIETMAQLSGVGAGGAICHVAGFAELGGAHREQQRSLAEAAGDLAMVGPNCMGLINAFDRVALWGDDSHFEAVDGPGVALISQSGALLYGVINAERAYPMGYAISLGNQAVIDAADAIEAALDDARVRAIGLYAEGVVDGPALGAALARALARGVPVVLLSGGGAPDAAARSISHTGTMAAPRVFWRALAERYGVIEVASPKQLIETTKLLAVAGAPRGPRLFVATYSGGMASLIAEQAPALGLALPAVSAANRDRVRPTLPEVITISNPLDLNLPWESRDGVSMADSSSIAQCLIDASRDQADAIAFLLDIPRAGSGLDEPWLPTVEAMIEARRRTDLPCIVSGLLPDGIEPAVRARVQAQDVAALQGLAETLEALGGANRWREAREALAVDPPAPLARLAPLGPTRALDEAESKALIEAHGLRCPPRWTGPASDAPAAAQALGFPVAVKILDAAIAHKSRIGGVRLGLRAAAEVAAAVAAMPGERFLVEPMIESACAELILGVKRHQQLGLALLVGRGGVETERWREAVLVLLPANDAGFARALDRLAIPLGEARPAVIRAMRAVARFAAAAADRLAELDINPLIVTEHEAIAVDALVVIGDGDEVRQTPCSTAP